MITIDQMLAALRLVKPVSKAQLYRYLKAFGIRPLGQLSTRPALYPSDSASKVIAGLGLAAENDVKQIITMRELKAERARTRRRPPHPPPL